MLTNLGYIDGKYYHDHSIQKILWLSFQPITRSSATPIRPALWQDGKMPGHSGGETFLRIRTCHVDHVSPKPQEDRNGTFHQVVKRFSFYPFGLTICVYIYIDKYLNESNIYIYI